jgi:hypothetical protein
MQVLSNISTTITIAPFSKIKMASSTPNAYSAITSLITLNNRPNTSTKNTPLPKITKNLMINARASSLTKKV